MSSDLKQGVQLSTRQQCRIPSDSQYWDRNLFHYEMKHFVVLSCVYVFNTNTNTDIDTNINR